MNIKMNLRDSKLKHWVSLSLSLLPEPFQNTMCERKQQNGNCSYGAWGGCPPPSHSPCAKTAPQLCRRHKVVHAHCLLWQLTSQLAWIIPRFQQRRHQDTCDRRQLPLKKRGGIPVGQLGAASGPGSETWSFHRASWQSGSGTSFMPWIGENGSSSILARLLRPWLESKDCCNVPHRSMLYLAKEWQFQTEQEGETRGKVLHLKNKPGATRGVGWAFRDLAVSGTRGACHPPAWARFTWFHFK